MFRIAVRLCPEAKACRNPLFFLSELTKRYIDIGPGAGAGKGGGSGGAIKESGGGMGKYAAAQEEGYFYNKTREQLEKLKKKLTGEVEGEKKKEE